MFEVSKFIENSTRSAIDFGHRKIIHPLLTRNAGEDREVAHEDALDLAEKLQDNPLAMKLMSRFFTVSDPILQTKMGSVEAPNPLGIAAGFDKNIRISALLGEGLGFGVVTVGSVTRIPYRGNPRPRIFDLPKNDGLINRMGFPGDGSDEAERRVSSLPPKRNYALVINVAASKTSFDIGTEIYDYGVALRQMSPYADAVEVNVSSPNTPGVRGLQEPERFKELASHIAAVRRSIPSNFNPPLIYKFGPDLPPEKLEKDLDIAVSYGAAGVTLTNTSTDEALRNSLIPEEHSQEAGGMSGVLLNARALEVTHRAYKYLEESMFINRAGGVRGTGEDLWKALTYGGAVVAETYASFVRPNTSTPNYSVYALRDLAKAMRMMGMTSMNDFRILRGKKVPYPIS